MVPVKIPYLNLVSATETSPEQNIIDLCSGNSELMDLVKQITSRKIISDAIWTKYRLGKLKCLLDVICGLDETTYELKQLLPNVVIVHWNAENVNTLYRLIY